MPEYSETERRNMDAVAKLFDPPEGFDPASLFAEDAVWWNGLPRLAGREGITEHKGIEAIRSILYGAGSDHSAQGIDSYDLSTNRFSDLVVLADGDYVVRQHTQHSKTHGGQDYRNVYCFVVRFNAAGLIQYLTEHWNTWYAARVLIDQWPVEPAHPEG